MSQIKDSPNGTTNKNEKPLSLYFASSLGALFVGIGDLTNQDASLTIKLGESLFPGVSTPYLSLLTLMIFGFVANWVYMSTNKIEAFARGCAIFSILNIANPYKVPEDATAKQNTSNTTSSINKKTTMEGSFLGITEAYAQTNEMSNFILKFKSNSNKESEPQARVTIRDAESKKILGRSWVKGELVVQRPPGKYILEWESPGYQRSQSQINIDDKTSIYVLPLEKSKVPLAIQRFYFPKEVELQREQLKPYAYYGMSYNGGWSKLHFKNVTVGKNEDAPPEEGDTVIAINNVNAREGIIEFVPKIGWTNKPIVGFISKGDKLKILNRKNVSGAFVWVQFDWVKKQQP
jgi:hypothetical protein